MKTTKIILLGMAVSALSTLCAVNAFSWSYGPYVVARPVYPQVYVGYPAYPPDAVCEYDGDPWAYYGPVYRAGKAFRVHRRHLGRRHW